jgi:hypothetical protein
VQNFRINYIERRYNTYYKYTISILLLLRVLLIILKAFKDLLKILRALRKTFGLQSDYNKPRLKYV